jgi:hypothetical protein
MSDVRGEICKIVSRMLDNPGEGGIYPTTRCYDELEALINAVRSEKRRPVGSGKHVLPIGEDIPFSTPGVVEPRSSALPLDALVGVALDRLFEARGLRYPASHSDMRLCVKAIQDHLAPVSASRTPDQEADPQGPPCPTCRNPVGGEEYVRHALKMWLVIDEVIAQRRGVCVSYVVGGDPIPDLTNPYTGLLPPKEQLLRSLDAILRAKARRAEGRDA